MKLALPRVTTVGELGATLPIGIVDGRKLKKDFSLRRYKSWIDRHMNLWREEHQGERMGLLVAKLLSLLVESVGDDHFSLKDDKNSTPEQLLKVLKLHYADAMYMYIYARIQAVGNEIELPYVCERCGNGGLAIADLNTLEVKVWDEPQYLQQWVELRDPITLRSGRAAKKVELRPITLQAQTVPGADSASLSYAALREAICGVDCESGYYNILDSELDELVKLDMVRLDRRANSLSAGPNLRTSIECKSPKCGAKIKEAFNWGYDTFFGSSIPLSQLID